MKILIIQGSSSSVGNTHNIVRILLDELKGDFIDLKKLNISPYDYQHKNKDDDFLPLFRNMVDKYEVLIFATPIYWYSMSGIMKNFLDRFTDGLTLEKDTGRKLRGMKMAALCCGSEELPTKGFFYPFRESADYLGMEYLGDLHTWIENKEASLTVIESIREFAKNIR